MKLIQWGIVQDYKKLSCAFNLKLKKRIMKKINYVIYGITSSSWTLIKYGLLFLKFNLKENV